MLKRPLLNRRWLNESLLFLGNVIAEVSVWYFLLLQRWWRSCLFFFFKRVHINRKNLLLVQTATNFEASIYEFNLIITDIYKCKQYISFTLFIRSLSRKGIKPSEGFWKFVRCRINSMLKSFSCLTAHPLRLFPLLENAEFHD